MSFHSYLPASKNHIMFG
uniref:Uncharacterized protein n=1 Tax=Anguilla anguilla TaxID=7936 RepID=A0A0E9W1D3_ANGAN